MFQNYSKIFQVKKNVPSRYCTSKTRLPQVSLRQVAQTSAKLTPGQSNPEETNCMEATPELGPVGFWSPKSSTFSGSNSIVVEKNARNFLSTWRSINKSE